MLIKMNSFVFFLCSFLLVITSCVEKVRYISVEHPMVTYVNPRYWRFFNMTTRRYGRRNPVYYVDIHFYVTQPLDNHVKVDFYFYEFLSNVYKRSFVEMHFTWCDLILKDKFFGAAMKQGNLAKPCPHMPGPYDSYNMTIPPALIPRSFPFRKGRIYCNMTHSKTKDIMGHGYINMEVKEVKRSDDKITFTDDTNHNIKQ